VLLALEGKFFVVDLEYLAGFLLPVEEIFHARLRRLQLLHLALKLCITAGRGGRTSNSGVLKALYCSAPGVPVVGLLQARRERKRGFQVRGVVVGGVVL
jgi:hypothetical protein